MVTAKNRELTYDRWQKFCGFLGAGIGGLLVIAGLVSDPFKDAPAMLHALFITLTLVSGVILGRAYVGYTQSAHNLRLATLEETTEIPSDRTDLAYPKSAFVCFWVSLLLIALAAIALLMAAWWPVFA